MSKDLRDRQAESLREQFQISYADFLLPILQVGNKTSIEADMLGHINLCPSSLLAKSA